MSRTSHSASNPMHFAPTTAVTADSRSVRHPSPGSYSSPGLIWHNVCPSSEPPASYGQPMQPRRQTHLSLTSEAPPKALRACVQCAQAGKAHECATNRRTIGCRRCNAQRLGCSYLGGTSCGAVAVLRPQTFSSGVPASLEDLEVPALLRRVNSALQSLSQQNQVMFDALQHMGARTSRIESHLSFLAKEGSPPFLLQPSSSRRSGCEEEDEYSTPTDGAWEPEVVDPATPSPLVEDTGKTAPPRRKRRRSVDQEDSERVHPRGLNIVSVVPGHTCAHLNESLSLVALPWPVHATRARLLAHVCSQTAGGDDADRGAGRRGPRMALRRCCAGRAGTPLRLRAATRCPVSWSVRTYGTELYVYYYHEHDAVFRAHALQPWRVRTLDNRPSPAMERTRPCSIGNPCTLSVQWASAPQGYVTRSLTPHSLHLPSQTLIHETRRTRRSCCAARRHDEMLSRIRDRTMNALCILGVLITP